MTTIYLHFYSQNPVTDPHFTRTQVHFTSSLKVYQISIKSNQNKQIFVVQKSAQEYQQALEIKKLPTRKD